MSPLVRIVLLLVIAVLLATTVAMGLTSDTGFVEKLALCAVAAILVLAAAKVNRLNTAPSTD